MKIISSKTTGNKKRVVIECAPDEQPMVIVSDGYYKLGYPVEDIVHANHIRTARPVMWCAIEQKWIE
jgi:hypothetical protein